MKKKGPLPAKDVNCYFRANTGVVILNSRNQVMAFERIDFPGSWQFPQGGVDANEAVFDTARRELREETHIDPDKDLHFVGELPEWIGYELPVEMRGLRNGRGQVQRWFFFRVKDDDLQVDLDSIPEKEKEFRAWKWMPMGELLEIVIPFRRPVYRRLQQWLEAKDHQ